MSSPDGARPHSLQEAKANAERLAFAPIAFQAARVLRDRGVLRAVEESGADGLTPDEAAAKLGLSLYALRVLLEAGLGIDLLRLEDGRYTLTRTGRLILHDEMTRTNMDFVHDVCYRAMYHFEESIAEGKPHGLKVFGDWRTVYEALASLPSRVQSSWFRFDHYYSDSAFPDALPIVLGPEPRRVLDIGGNTGRWALLCARRSERVSITIADLPGQLAKAEAAIAQEGLGARISTYPVDILDPASRLPEGFDVLWMSQFLVCFSEPEIVAILRKAGEAMDSDSVLYILDTYWDRQRNEIARHCLLLTSLYFTCIANGNSRMYHSNDILRCVEAAGLQVENDLDGLGISHTLFRCRRAPAT